MKDSHVRKLINNEEVPIIKKSRKDIFGKVIYYILGSLISLFFIFPILYMFAASTKSQQTIAFHAGTVLMFVPDFANFGSMFDNYIVILSDQYNFGRYALNSFLYASIAIVLNVIINGLAAYAISKLTFPGKKFFNFIIMFLIIVPVETSIIPLFVVVKQLLGFNYGALNIVGLILPSIISIFNIFLFIQFFSSIPKEFEEAARMDGANTIKIFFKVILPLSKPIIATVAVFCFIGVWNDYLWPILMLDYDQQIWSPIQSALTSLQADGNIETGQIMAALVTTSLPIFLIYIFAQKYIIKGFGAGGLKL